MSGHIKLLRCVLIFDASSSHDIGKWRRGLEYGPNHRQIVYALYGGYVNKRDFIQQFQTFL